METSVTELGQPPDPELERQEKVLWALRLRTVLLTGLIVLYGVGLVAGILYFRPLLAGLLAFFFVANLVRMYLSRRHVAPEWLTRLMILLDVLGISILVALSGGALSFLLPLYFVQVVAVNLHTSVRFGFVTTGLSVLCLAGIAVAEYNGALSHANVLALPASSHLWESGTFVAASLISFAFLLGIATYSSGYVASRLRIREDQLDKARRKLLSLYRVSHSLSATLRPQEVVDAFLRGILDNFHYNRCALYLLDETDRLLECRNLTREGETPTTSVLDERKIRQMMDTKHPAHVQDRQVVVMIRSADRTRGILMAEAGNGITRLDTEPMVTLGNQFLTALEKAELHERTEHLSITDELTRVYNRRHLLAKLRDELERSRRYGHPTSFALLDIDHFKQINDHFGHPSGDAVLRGLAERLQSDVREIDMVGRYGGEEFGIVLPQSDLTRALGVAERIRRRIEGSPFETPSGPVTVTASLGVATYPNAAGQTAEDILRHADEELYRAKEGGRNRVCPNPTATEETPATAPS